MALSLISRHSTDSPDAFSGGPSRIPSIEQWDQFPWLRQAEDNIDDSPWPALSPGSDDVTSVSIAVTGQRATWAFLGFGLFARLPNEEALAEALDAIRDIYEFYMAPTHGSLLPSGPGESFVGKITSRETIPPLVVAEE